MSEPLQDEPSGKLVATTYIAPFFNTFIRSKQAELGFTSNDIDEIEKMLKAHWKDMDVAFNNVKEHIESNYRLNVRINKAIVILGVVLLSTSIVYSWIRGVDLFTTITSGIAVADFVALFLYNPQTKIRRVLGDLVQMQVIYRTWAFQTIVATLLFIRNKNNDAEVKIFQDSLGTFAKQAVDAIESNIGNDEQSSKQT